MTQLLMACYAFYVMTICFNAYNDTIQDKIHNGVHDGVQEILLIISSMYMFAFIFFVSSLHNQTYLN